jgi:hypothetical protein
MAVDDVTDQYGDFPFHIHKMTLWPQQWLGYRNRVPCQWQHCRLEQASRLNVPTTPGVYTLIIMSSIAGHPFGSYLMYVGQATSLRRRFGEYLNAERRASGRPKIFKLLNLYESHLWFCYTEAPRISITDLEDDLLEAFIPPCNNNYPASIRRTVRAFE